MGSEQDIPRVSPSTPPLAEGTDVGGYLVTHQIGQGGMGEVYAAQHPLIGKRVAIKVLAPHYVTVPDMVRRFMEEARAVNKIGHPNIIDIFSFGQLPDGRHFMVMEYLEGENLARRLERDSVPVLELRRLLGEICEALEAAHQAGIVHRDLKPENIWILGRGPEDSHIKLLDFGIAKLLGVDTRHATQTGITMGTPLFMPPEQCLGRTIDHRADIYSFGVILYLIFTGVMPFTGETLVEIVFRHTTEAPQPPSRHRPLPEALEQLILDCLEKDPDRRPQSARIVGERLFAALRGGGPVARVPYEAMGSSTAPRQTQTLAPESRAAGRTGRLAAAAVGVAVGLALLVGGLLQTMAPPAPPGELDAAAGAARARLEEAVASRARTLEPTAAQAARVHQLVSALDLAGNDVATLQNVFDDEESWAPYRTPPVVSALVSSGRMLAKVGQGLGDLTGSEIVRQARERGSASGLVAGSDRLFIAAAVRASGTKARDDGVVVLVGTPVNRSELHALAERTGDGVGVTDGIQLQEGVGEEGARRALLELAAHPGRRHAVLLDARDGSDHRWAGTALAVGEKLALLGVFRAPAAQMGTSLGLPLAILGGVLLVIALVLSLRTLRPFARTGR
jgi:serine/threonine-protein kinase